jgi:hypothetical protein
MSHSHLGGTRVVARGRQASPLPGTTRRARGAACGREPCVGGVATRLTASAIGRNMTRPVDLRHTHPRASVDSQA